MESHGKSRNLKTWKLEYNHEGFWCCFVDILNQKLISVCGASYYYYSRERGVGNEHREWEIEKWEQQQRTGNKVTDRARVQVCSIFHCPFSVCSFPILVASVCMSLFRLETWVVALRNVSSFLKLLLKRKQKEQGKTSHYTFWGQPKAANMTGDLPFQNTFQDLPYHWVHVGCRVLRRDACSTSPV